MAAELEVRVNEQRVGLAGEARTETHGVGGGQALREQQLDGIVMAQDACIPLQSSRRFTAQSGTSCSATTSGASDVTSRTIRSRWSVADCGCVSRGNVPAADQKAHAG